MLNYQEKVRNCYNDSNKKTCAYNIVQSENDYGPDQIIYVRISEMQYSGVTAHVYFCELGDLLLRKNSLR